MIETGCNGRVRRHEHQGQDTIPASTTEQSNRINTAKRVPLRLHSSSIDRGFEENSVTAAMLRSDDTIRVPV